MSLSALWVAVSGGAMLAGVERAVHQWMPETAASPYLVFSGVLLGIAVAMAAMSWSISGVRRDWLSGWLMLGLPLAALVCVAGFRFAVHGALWGNAYLDEPWMLMLLRAGLVFIATIPLGVSLVGASWMGERRSLGRWAPFAMMAGYIAVVAFAADLSAAAILTASTVSATTMMAVFPVFSAGVGYRRILPLCCAATMLLAVLTGRGLYEPSYATRLLFAADAAGAYRAGMDRPLLTAISDARPLSTISGAGGTYTLWKSRANQYEIRVDGMPDSFATADPLLCPDYPAEVLHAVLPLVLKDRTTSITVLGAGSGTTLKACLAFPVFDIRCIEPDAARRATVNEIRQRTSWGAMLDDDRLTWSTTSVEMAVRSGAIRSDVVLCLADQPVLRRQSGRFTRDYYRHAKSCLTEDGIFCQRLRAIDYGPHVVAGLAEIWGDVFDDFAVLSVGSGDYLLIAAAGEDLGFSSKMVERLQRPHVRTALANVGSDWSTVLNVPLLTRDGLLQLSANHGDESRLQSTSPAFCLPYELMRWGRKSEEMSHAWLATERQTRLIEHSGEEANSPDLLRRLAEVSARQNLIRDFPDEYWWEYRRTLRDYMTRARSTVQQVSATEGSRIHPEDRRRMAYFTALGKAAKQPHPPLTDVDRVERSVTAYDPLITQFMHQELAELHSRAEPSNPAAELAHRLHAIYHSTGNDRSVRNVIDAIELVVAEPESCPDPATRYDHLNALVQMLKYRWEFRRQVNPKSARITINDINKSIAALDAACEAMADAADAAAVTPTDCDNRCQVLELTLRRPLRAYRTQLQRHDRRNRAVAERAKQTTPSSVPGL